MDLLAPRTDTVRRGFALIGDGLRRNRRLIAALQWAVVALYLFLLLVPALLPLPEREAHIWNNLTLFAQFMFWGIWWPFVLLSMVLVGRSWCGLFCPEGTLSEAASTHGLGRAVPRWVRWKGWPFTAFALTTIYGQMVSVYQYPWPVVVVLGGSTAAAMAIGFAFGREKRVWCRYLCPVNGVFGLLAKLAPVHYRVDETRWRQWSKPAAHAALARIDCAPLVPIATMKGGQLCHMCGRCSGFRDAVALSTRSPADEIVTHAYGKAGGWETVLIVFGMIGLASGAFHWSSSDWLVQAKVWAAERLVEAGIVWPLEPLAPWWILTNYPDQNDTMSVLDGTLALAYMLGLALATGAAILLCLALAARVLGPWDRRRFNHIAQALIPVAGCGLFLGLSGLTVTMLKAEGVWLGFVPYVRAVLIVLAAAWSIYLGARIAAVHTRSLGPRTLATAFVALAAVVAGLNWSTLYWPLI